MVATGLESTFKMELIQSRTVQFGGAERLETVIAYGLMDAIQRFVTTSFQGQSLDRHLY